MSLKGRLRRLAREAKGDGIVLRQKDGTTRIFDAMEVHKEMFLARMDLLRDTVRESDVLEAARNSTPESRRHFEERFGSMEMTHHIIAAAYQGGWVETLTLHEDGTLEKVRHEGGSKEAERIREGVRQEGVT
jgi:hypothetical protein